MSRVGVEPTSLAGHDFKSSQPRGFPSGDIKILTSAIYGQSKNMIKKFSFPKISTRG
ncbi:MAG: hypothetical protein UV08_C0040G0007 [Parcubacteria group bacterium GW2011_GWA2_42_18]|nr:MAG: hypothetical protein UV08_C0040G0007 [Parcubacteria group bacterium GW2011_GWA2_42_18]